MGTPAQATLLNSYKMNSPLKSRASLKFRANHPAQHQMFVNLVKNAKQTKSKFLWQREENEINGELANMVKNQENSQFRLGDVACDRLRKRSRNLKRVSWKKSLCEFRTISENRSAEISSSKDFCAPTKNFVFDAGFLPSESCEKPTPAFSFQAWVAGTCRTETMAVEKVPDLLLQRAFVGNAEEALSNPEDKTSAMETLPDIVKQTFSKTSCLKAEIPDLLNLGDLTHPTEPLTSHQDISESTSPESFTECTGNPKNAGYLRLSFFTECDQRRRLQR